MPFSPHKFKDGAAYSDAIRAANRGTKSMFGNVVIRYDPRPVLFPGLH
ncbi:MAG: hypothetical protein NTX48_10410 [Planctomycetales bacterium]|nr:hypothetical protein [Planctomycetales bacterium]